MQDRCNNAEFLDNSIRDVEKGDPNFRPSTDAPSTPFLEMTDEGKEAELLTENCGNPTLFDMSEQALCALDSEIWGNICDNNPWLKECLGLTDEHGLKAAFVNDDFTLVNGNSKLCAALTNKLIRDADLVGVVVEPSIENRHLPGPVAGGLPRTKLNPEQEAFRSSGLSSTPRNAACGHSGITSRTSDGNCFLAVRRLNRYVRKTVEAVGQPPPQRYLAPETRITSSTVCVFRRPQTQLPLRRLSWRRQPHSPQLLAMQKLSIVTQILVSVWLTIRQLRTPQWTRVFPMGITTVQCPLLAIRTRYEV